MENSEITAPEPIVACIKEFVSSIRNDWNKLSEPLARALDQRCLSFLKDAVSCSRARRKIVVTHHVPSFQMQCPKFADSQANGAFTVELEEYIKNSGIDYWIFGHSHYNVDVKIGNTNCVSNQLGYVFHGEHESFNPGKYIEV